MKKVYIDTGIFLDYHKTGNLKSNNIYTTFVMRNASRKIKRQSNRNGRNPSKLYDDAEKIFKKSKEGKIFAYTSVLTLIELEEVFFDTMKKIFKGKDDVTLLSIISSRDFCKHYKTLLKTFNIKLVGIKNCIHTTIFNEENTNHLQIRDSIHLAIAKETSCDLLCSSDSHFHNIKNVRNNKNIKMLCADSDVVLRNI